MNFHWSVVLLFHNFAIPIVHNFELHWSFLTDFFCWNSETSEFQMHCGLYWTVTFLWYAHLCMIISKMQISLSIQWMSLYLIWRDMFFSPSTLAQCASYGMTYSSCWTTVWIRVASVCNENSANFLPCHIITMWTKATIVLFHTLAEFEFWRIHASWPRKLNNDHTHRNCASEWSPRLWSIISNGWSHWVW